MEQTRVLDPVVGPSPVAPVSTRLLSLDVFRGITMASMVIVNNPGDWGNVYAPLLHAPWNGWTPTDLIFPFFLFIVGVSLTLSRSTMSSWPRVVRRAALIFLVGLALTGIPRFPFATWRIPGVLQRIGICYLVAAAIFRTVRRDGRSLGAQAVAVAGWAAVFILLYWALISWVAPPGGVAGDLSQTGNLGGFIDRTVIGINHMYQRRAWDPEGILSSLPAIGTTLLGCLAGLCLACDFTPARKSVLLATAGVAFIALGIAWDRVLPINKNLWTSSYVVFTAGAAALLLALCYWLIDVRGWKRWAKPFEILGVNAIALFVLSALLAKLLMYVQLTVDERGTSLGGVIYSRWYAPFASPKNASLMFALTHLAMMFAILLFMYRKRVFVKL